MDFVDELENKFPGLFDRLNAEITAEKVYKFLKPIADTPAPFQTISGTRAIAIQDLLNREECLSNKGLKFVRNYKNTGNAVILTGNDDEKKNVWLLAHLDMITYLVEKQLSNNEYLLKPICYHLINSGKRRALVIGFDVEKNGYFVVSRGDFVSTKRENQELREIQIIYKPDEPVDIHPGMRVCFESELTWDKKTGEVQGSLDDAAGAAAITLATCFLSGFDIDIMCGLTDEEEGLAGHGSQSIGRGGARLIKFFDQPDLVIASDIHEAADMYGGGGPDNFELGMGASFSEKSSHGVGEITPPNLYEFVRKLASDLKKENILLNENIGGYVSRTEGINAMLRTPMVSLIGFLGKNRHFEHGFETTNMNDLVNLTKSIISLALLTRTEIWRNMG